MSIILNIVSLIYNIVQGHLINELNYTNRSIEKKPILELYEGPNISLESVEFKSKLIKSFPTKEIAIDISYFFRETIKFKNISKEKAEIILFMQTDTFAKKDYLRNIIFDKDHFIKKFKKHIDEDTSYFVRRELLPGDTIVFSNIIGGSVFNMDNYYVRHYLIMYDNEYENRYDTYLKFRYKITKPYEEPCSQPDGSIHLKPSKNNSEFFKLEELPVRSTKTYTKEQKKQIDKLITEFNLK